MHKQRLPCLNEQPVGRRPFVLGAVSACVLTACGVAIPEGDGGEPQPDAGGTDGTDAGTMGADAADDASACMPGPVRLGSLDSFATGTWTLITAARMIVGHDDGGLYAYSAVCTHAGCTVNPPSSTGQALCPCHRSLFDGDGAVVNGPATRPLAHYAVTICDGVAYANRSQTVDPSTRTAVP
jgi:thiosulfate dehydrogenase [quinone] large subunit